MDHPEITPDHPDCGCESTSDCKSCLGYCPCLTDWTEWGPCDGPCGSGYQEREREDPCFPPDVNGETAPPEVETRECGDKITCTPEPWGDWSECDAECDGIGQIKRSRDCSCPEGVDQDDEECGCDGTTACETCYGKPCSCPAEDAEWTPCDGPCGGGIRTKTIHDPCANTTEIETEKCEEISE